MFSVERRSETQAHPSAHGRRADRPGQGRGAGFCAAGRVHQRICFSGQPPQAFQRESHLCNVTHFSAVFPRVVFPFQSLAFKKKLFNLFSCTGC